MQIEIRDEYARSLSLFLKRITYEDAFRRTDCGYTDENRKAQAYRFLDGVSDVEKSLNEQIYQQNLKKEAEQETQGMKR